MSRRSSSLTAFHRVRRDAAGRSSRNGAGTSRAARFGACPRSYTTAGGCRTSTPGRWGSAGARKRVLVGQLSRRDGHPGYGLPVLPEFRPGVVVAEFVGCVEPAIVAIECVLADRQRLVARPDHLRISALNAAPLRELREPPLRGWPPPLAVGFLVLAALVEPVGEHHPRRDVVLVGGQGGQECLSFVHPRSPDFSRRTSTPSRRRRRPTRAPRSRPTSSSRSPRRCLAARNTGPCCCSTRRRPL